MSIKTLKERFSDHAFTGNELAFGVGCELGFGGEMHRGTPVTHILMQAEIDEFLTENARLQAELNKLESDYTDQVLRAMKAEEALDKLKKQEPVLIYHGRCIIDCGDGGHQDVTMLKMIAAGSKLYLAAGAQPQANPETPKPIGWDCSAPIVGPYSMEDKPQAELTDDEIMDISRDLHRFSLAAVCNFNWSCGAGSTERQAMSNEGTYIIQDQNGMEGLVSIGTITAARIESNVPESYRLTRKLDGSTELQGAFRWCKGYESGLEWRDIPVWVEPTT